MNEIPVESVETFVERAAPFGFSGAVLVGKGEEIVTQVACGLADRRRDVANTVETAFSVGSISKQFTAACIMTLAQRGQIDLHASIGDYLPGVPVDKRAITLHHLLTHTAGLVNYTGGDFDDGADREHMLVTAMEAPLSFEPGTRYDYSNAGYSLLAVLVEVVGGRPYESFLRDELLEPAGMPFTGYRAPDWSQRTVARWYAGAADNGTPLEKPYPSWNLLGNGGILSNVGDLFRWWQALKEEELLSAATRETLFTPFLDDYAYGWSVHETERGRLIEHGGASSYGASATFRWYVDHDVLLVILSNALYKRAFGAQVLEPLLDRLLFGEAVPMPPAVEPTGVAPVAVGTYVIDGDDAHPFTLEAEGAGLRLHTASQNVINGLLFPSNEEAGTFVERNTRLAHIFGAALADDFGPLLEEVGDEARVSRYREIFADYWAEYAAENGGARPPAVRVLATLPSFLPDAELTELHVPGPAEDLVLQVHYRQGKWVGVSQGMLAEPLEMKLQPAGAVRYVDFDLRSGQLVSLDVEAAGDRVTLNGILPAARISDGTLPREDVARDFGLL